MSKTENKIKAYKRAAGAVAQLVLEYPDFGDEHIEDMFLTFHHTGEECPVPGGIFQGLCYKARNMVGRNSLITYDEIVALLTVDMIQRNVSVNV